MTDWSPLVPAHGSSPQEEAVREAQHLLIIDLLAGYLDNELPAETRAQIDAHLIGCTSCRRELRVQEAVRRRLSMEPPAAAPPALRDRIAIAIAEAPRADIPRNPWRTRAWILAAVAGVGLLATVATIATRGEPEREAAPAARFLAAPAGTVPLLQDVLADYRRVTATDLPGRARDLEVVRRAVPFEVEALRAEELRLVGAWTTAIGSEPAAVLAYRRGDEVVVQYLVSEEQFFRNPALRSGVAGGRVLTASDGAERLVSWPVKTAGSVLVGALPAAAMERIAREDRLARTMGGGAE